MSRAFVATTESPWALGARFVKEVLREGTYQHPIKPWAQPLRATKDFLEALAARSNDALAHNIDVPIPDGHDDRAVDNAGWAKRFYVDRNTDGTFGLFIEADITDPAYAEKIKNGSINKVSVYIDAFGDGQYDPKGDRVIHVALTGYPVAAKQGGFIALSANSNKTVPVLTRLAASESPMLTLSLDRAKALGLTVPADAKDSIEVNEAALSSLLGHIDGEKARTDEAVKAALAAQKPAEFDPTPENVAKALTVDVSKDRRFARAQTALANAVDAEVKLALVSGRITVPMGEQIKALLSAECAFALGVDGKASVLDVPAAVRALLALIPEKAMVPVVDRGGLTTEPPKVETDTALAAKAAAEAGERMAAFANGGIPTK